MKLCKDCKHYVAPSNPAMQYPRDTPYYHMPMCGHPEARRSVVNGDFLTSCVNARGVSDIGDGKTFETICGKGAELFEKYEPEQHKVRFIKLDDPNDWSSPRSICFEKYKAATDKPWWRRMFGG